MESVERPLTTKQAAEFLGVHFKTVEKFAREGRIPAHRIGEKILRFYETELDDSAARHGIISQPIRTA